MFYFSTSLCSNLFTPFAVVVYVTVSCKIGNSEKQAIVYIQKNSIMLTKQSRWQCMYFIVYKQKWRLLRIKHSGLTLQKKRNKIFLQKRIYLELSDQTESDQLDAAKKTFRLSCQQFIWLYWKSLAPAFCQFFKTQVTLRNLSIFTSFV